VSEPLFVTSCNEELWHASGDRLVSTFLAVGQPGRLLVCAEFPRLLLSPHETSGRVDYYDLAADPYLKGWLRDNADHIPDYLGGRAKECSCPGRHKRHAKHKKFGCHWQWMNRNASRWFRKVASLRAAVKHAQSARPARHLVWLDADCYFRRALPPDYLARKLEGVALFYFRGHRLGVEAGILGFDLDQGGAKFVKALCRQYETKAYLKSERWDDGFQMGVILDRKEYRTRDLVHPTRWGQGRHKTNDVIPTTDVSEYLRHEKGRHGTRLDIMK
jgi:hypothetical protein